jgi:hypothetical protein
VALFEQEEDLSLEEFEEKLNKAVANAGAIWNSAYAVLKAAMLETETARIRVEAREKVIRDQEKAVLDLRHKEESKSLPKLQFFRSLKNKGPGNNEDDVHAWANLFVRTLTSAAIKPWRWPAAMDSCLGDVHRQWLAQKVPLVTRTNIVSEATFRSILLDPFVTQVEGVLGEAEKYRSLRYLKQQENQSVAHYTEKVVQLQQKLRIDDRDQTWIQLYIGGLLPDYIAYVDEKSTHFRNLDGIQTEVADFGTFLQVQSLAKAAEQIKHAKKKGFGNGIVTGTLGPTTEREGKNCWSCQKEGKPNIPFTLEHRQKVHGYKDIKRMFNLEKGESDPERDPDYELWSLAQAQQNLETEMELNNVEQDEKEGEKIFVKTPIRINGVNGTALVDSGAIGAYIQDIFLIKLGLETGEIGSGKVKRGGISEAAFESVTLEVYNGDKIVNVEFTPMKSIEYDVILGRDWFGKFGYRMVGIPATEPIMINGEEGEELLDYIEDD